MLTQTIYDRLNTDETINELCGGSPARINPTRGTTNTDLPYIVFSTAENPLQQPITSGSLDLERYTLTIDLWARTQAEGDQLSNAIKNRLHLWDDSPVELCRLVTRTQSPEQRGRHHSHEYTLVVRTA